MTGRGIRTRPVFFMSVAGQISILPFLSTEIRSVSAYRRIIFSAVGKIQSQFLFVFVIQNCLLRISNRIIAKFNVVVPSITVTLNNMDMICPGIFFKIPPRQTVVVLPCLLRERRFLVAARHSRRKQYLPSGGSRQQYR